MLYFLPVGLCAEKAGIKPIHSHLFMNYPHENVCESVGMIAQHEDDLNRMKEAYDAVMKRNIICSAPDQYTRFIRDKTECV